MSHRRTIGRVSERAGCFVALAAGLRLIGPVTPPVPGADPVESVVWTSMVNVTASGGTIQRTTGCDGCYAGAASRQSIVSGDGFMEFTVVEIDTSRAAGLSHGDTDATLQDIDFAIEIVPLQNATRAYVRENGIYRGETGVASGDVLRVAVEGGQVVYRSNGSPFYTSAVVPVYPLLVDSSLSTAGATIANTQIGGNLDEGPPPPPPPPPPPDTTPPVRSNGHPTGVLPAGTTQVLLSLTTDENATCRYDIVPGTDFASMTGVFDTTGGTAHSTTVTGLIDGGAYDFHVRCRDAALNADPDDFDIAFSTAVDSGLPPGFEESPFVTGLDFPTAMAFAPDGRLFVAEKSGGLRVVKDGVLLADPFLTAPVETFQEQGLLGVAFDPGFASNGFVYVYYTNLASGRNRVSRFAASASDPDLADPASEVVMLDDIPSNGSHDGGAIHFGSDGMLYIAVGDTSAPDSAQSLAMLSGKLLRIDPGAFPDVVPPDNPFIGTPGARGEIWALGLRNPFTFAVDPATGRIHVDDVGGNVWEEIDLGAPGANYGWPRCEGPCGEPGMTDPIYAYQHDAGSGASIVGGAFYRGTAFPAAYDGSYFFGDFVRGFIDRLDPGGTMHPFTTATDTFVGLAVGPDGSLYYLSIYSGTVHQIRYVGGGNHTPIAVASASPTTGPAPLAVAFDGSASSDPDGNPLVMTWDFGDGSPSVAGATASHVYPSDGPYGAVLTVDDGHGGVATATVDIRVGNPPAADITEPADGTHYDAGDTIAYAGTATDAEDGTLPASAFRWTIVLHHLDHEHPFLGPIDGVTGGSFTIPTVGHAEDDRVYYHISLTVTDSSGLTTVVTRDILPNKSVITLATDPPGLPLTLDGQPVTMPDPVTSVVGIVRTLGAAPTVSMDGLTYTFVSWSDGGAATHDIATPPADTTFTATYREAGVAATNIVWTDLVNVTVTGATLSRSGGCDGCDAGAVSVQTIDSGDGAVEFTAVETDTDRAAGLSHGDTDAGLADIDFAIQLVNPPAGPRAYVRENGIYRWEVPYAAGDRFRVGVEGGQVTYRQNGAVFYTSAVAPTYPLLVDTSLASPGATIQDAALEAPVAAAPAPPPPPDGSPRPPRR